MPKFIIHHDGLFFEWSTIVDAPTSRAMPRDAFIAEWRELYGSKGVEELLPRLERAAKTGTSLNDPMSARDAVRGNRAGPREGELSFEQIIELVKSELP